MSDRRSHSRRVEIADVMLERIKRLGWQKAWWSSADGMDICSRYSDSGNGLYVQRPGTYIFLHGYMDLDYQQAFLLTVCTQTDEETWVDYLSVFQGVRGKLDVEWAQRPHRFFEPADHLHEAQHWWVDLVHRLR